MCAPGVLFGGKEQYMETLNPYITRKGPAIKKYFRSLTDEVNPRDALKVRRCRSVQLKQYVLMIRVRLCVMYV